MIDPVRIGDAVIDRAALVALLRHEGKVYLFLRGSKVLTMSDTFSQEELEELTRRPIQRVERA